MKWDNEAHKVADEKSHGRCFTISNSRRLVCAGLAQNPTGMDLTTYTC